MEYINLQKSISLIVARLFYHLECFSFKNIFLMKFWVNLWMESLKIITAMM